MTEACWICDREVDDGIGTGRRKDGRLAHSFCLLAVWFTGQKPEVARAALTEESEER